MPTYTFRNKETGRSTTQFMSVSERDTFLEENPKFEQVPSAPHIHSGRGMGKPDSSFRDVLKEIKNKHGAGGRIRTDINTF